MRVSVNVVEGSSVESSTSNFVALASNSSVNLGSLILKGSSSRISVITMSSAVDLSDGEGNNIQLDISSSVEESALENVTKLAFSGFIPRDVKEGSYQGQLSATIEYY